MSKFQVTPEELRSAARKIEQNLTEYQQANDAAINAGMNLAAAWEGDSQKAFVQEQEKVKQWYAQMNNVVKTYSAALTAAAAIYEAADQAAKSAINNG